MQTILLNWLHAHVLQTVPTKVKATYSGGEKRIDIASQLTHAAVVTEGASLGSKDLIPLAILQRIMGIGPSVKYSEHLATSKVSILRECLISKPNYMLNRGNESIRCAEMCWL